MGTYPKFIPYLAIFALGVASPLAWNAVFSADPVDRLLLPHDERVEVLPHMFIPHALKFQSESDEFEADTNYRRLLHWNAATELFGYHSHANNDGQFVDGIVAGTRNSLTRMQIAELKPSFLRQYDALYSAMQELDAVLCEMRVANSGTSAWEDDPCLAPSAELLARLAHYQMAKGGRGGDAELDFPAFERGISITSRSIWPQRRTEYPPCRRRLLDVVRRVDVLLVEWDPACAKLLVEHINNLTDAFRRE